MYLPNMRKLARSAARLFTYGAGVLFLLSGLLISQAAFAQAVFSNLTATPTSGTVDPATGKLSVTFTGTVASMYNGDAVNYVSVYDNGTVIKGQSYPVSFSTRTGDPINTARNINYTLQFAPGTHSVVLKATTYWEMEGSSQTFTIVASPSNGGAYVSQSVPTAMVAGQTYNVSVTMSNTGTKTWTSGGANPHALGSQNPQDNVTWGMGRVYPSGSVAPGSNQTFNFTVTAPNTAGTFNFQWRMVQEGVEWFGGTTPNVAVTVSVPPPPSVAFSSPAEGSTYVASGSYATVSFAGTASPGSGAWLSSVQLLEGGVVFASGSSSSISGSKALSPGSHSIELRATDNRGQTTSTYRTVYVVPPPPTAAITSPANSASYTASGSTASVAVTATATPGSGASISQMRLYVNGGLQTTSATSSLSSTVALSPGSHTIGVEATDNYGGVSSRSNVTVTVVAPTPTITITAPANNANFYTNGSTAPVSVQGTAVAVGGSPISKIELLDGATVIDTQTGVTAYAATVNLAFGQHGLRLRATNSAGGQGDSATIYVTVQSQGQVTLTSPTASSSLSVGQPATLSATAPASNVTAVRFYLNGNQIASGTNNAGNWSASWTPMNGGSFSFEARAFDSSGTQLAASSAATVNVAAVSSSDTPVPITVNVPQLSNPDGGSLPGSVAVSGSGSAGYPIKLQLPPGILGMVPDIGLSYDSDSPIGAAGLGWNIDGISKIERCGKTTAIDGKSDGVRFIDSFNQRLVDRLCLDGQRLVLINGNASVDADYWSDSAEFRTEVESFTRVTALVRNGKRAFKVETKDGRTSYYGDTADSYIEAVGRSDGAAHRWYVSSTSDRSGNTINYAYSEDSVTGESKPLTVSWGANSSKGTSHFAKLNFTYESRKDPRTRYVAGSPVADNLRLSVIETTVDSSDNGAGQWTSALKYTLSYTTSATSGRSLLSAIAACDASRCLPATTFTYGQLSESPVRAFQPLGDLRAGPNFSLLRRNPQVPVEPMQTIAVADFNGDGKADIIERERVAGNQYQQHLYQSTADGTNWTVSTPLSGVPGDVVIQKVGDFDGDGLPDLLVADFASFAPTNWRLCLAAQRSAGNYQCNTSLALPAAALGPVIEGHVIADFNADGKDDLFIRAMNGLTPHAFQCLSNGAGFACTEVTGTRDEVSLGAGGNPLTSSGSVNADVDGDGRGDTLLLSKCVYEMAEDETKPRWHCSSVFGADVGGITVYNHPERGGVYFSSGWNRFPTKTTGILPQMASGSLSADLNSDGYTDMVFGSVDLLSTGSVGTFSGRICSAKGDGGAECRNLPLSNFSGQDHLVMTMGDFDGDGVYDVLRPSNDAWNQNNVTGYLLCRIGADRDLGADPMFHHCEAWSGPTFYSLSQQVMFDGASSMGEGVQSMFLGDFDGDGKQDIATYLNNGQWRIHSAANQAKPNEALDRLVEARNGVGNIEKIDYSLPNDANVYQPMVARPDGQNAVGKLIYPARPLVKAVHRSNGASGWRDTTYQYARMAMDAGGRGNLGFAQVSVTDTQRGSKRTTWACLSYPQIGAECGSQEVSASGVVLSSTVNEWAMRTFSHASGGMTASPYLAKSTVVRRDPDNADLGKTVVTNGLPDAWGNILETTTVSSSDTNVAGWSARKSMTFDNDSSSWRLGELRTLTETRTNDYNTIGRQTSYTYDVLGRLATEVRESSDSAQKLTTTYDRSTIGFGLVGKTILSWTDPASLAPMTRTVSDATYTANGRFVATVKNALGHMEQRSSDPRTGVVASVISPNGLSATTTSDGFGRVLSLTAPDGTVTETSIKSCTSGCPSGAATVMIQEAKRADGVRVAVPVLQFADSTGHVMRTLTWGFDGSQIVSDTTYDELGRTGTVYWPRFGGATDGIGDASSSAIVKVQTTYDILDRPRIVRTKDEAGATQTTTHDWVGFTHKVTNPKNQQISETANVWGKTATAVDANAKVTQFVYDAFGNLVKTTDPLGNTVVVSYDDWGRRVQLKDPDLGTITYGVDPLGQVWRQVSPNEASRGQATTMQYDALGRMISRSSSDMSATWTYDLLAGQSGCAAYRSCGQLVQSSTLAGGTAVDFRQQHTYDAVGRPDTTTTWLDTTYSTKRIYDVWGRLVREQHQRGSDAVKGYDRRYNAWGQLVRIERAGQPLWTATTRDAALRITAASLGNGLGVSQQFNPYTGRLALGNVGSTLAESYQYDVLGNVSQRVQQWGGTSFTEDFAYDGLNRLRTAAIVGYAQQVFAYDDIGNIVSKTGTGTGNYVYPASGAGSVRPHAVSSIPGVGSFGYDANGNLTSGAGRTATWNSFDMPVTITKGTASSTFYYGADHQRVKQVRSDGVTIWYAGAMEVETGAGTTVKTYLPEGMGVEIDKNGTTQVIYAHRDRLGSVVAMSNQAGALVETMAYDSWGKRRSEASPSTPDAIDGQTDNKGFTGHEMLDQLDLVHMNGRVYDPMVARFVSADPVIQDPLHSQSYNRYSYVWNNPTNLTDPTGFLAETGVTAGAGASEIDQGRKRKEEPRYACIDRAGRQVDCHTGTLVTTGAVHLTGCQGKDGSGGCSVVWRRADSANKKGSFARFFNDLDLKGVATQFGRRLMADFVNNNKGKGDGWAWLAEKAEDYFEKPEEASANGVVAKVGAVAAAMMTPGGARGTIAKEIQLSRKLHGEAAVHAADAIAAGKPSVLTIERAGAPANRNASIGALDKVPGKHLDEYPPAMFREGGSGASVRAISPRDNMSAGACIGNACRGLPDGTKVRITVGD